MSAYRISPPCITIALNQEISTSSQPWVLIIHASTYIVSGYSKVDWSKCSIVWPNVQNMCHMILRSHVECGNYKLGTTSRITKGKSFKENNSLQAG